MYVLAILAGAFLIAITLLDGFETIILPRRVRRQIRITWLFYELTWNPYSKFARRIPDANKRESMLGYFGPLSLIGLIVIWALFLVTGFALLEWGFGSHLTLTGSPDSFGIDLYESGTTFFTLGLGDVTPVTTISRIITTIESGMGLGFLALIVSYLPALNNAFSRREVNVSMLDERAGSPPTAFELIRRYGRDKGPIAAEQFLFDWERWSAELMESHLSYPVLAYFRSQHDNQSWITALTMILDLSALVLTGIDGVPKDAARLTFAMARHACVDLSQIFFTPPRTPRPDRLPEADLAILRRELATTGLNLCDGAEADRYLAELRQMYEPYVAALANYLVVTLPPWLPPADKRDNWQTTAWEQS
jgi:hypothetical protein